MSQNLIATDQQADLAYNANLPGRKTFDIHGGVHPAENKQQSVQSPIEQAPIPAQLTYPLSQHIGAPAKPVVAVGDKVLKGQQIAEANGFVSVPVHASTSGTIVAIESRPIAHPSGFDAPCIVLESDGKDQWIEHQGIDDYTQLEKHELINIIRNAGIAGMGGAGFPSAVKLNTRDDQVIESLIINGTECEPYITADDMLMRERAEQIIQGASILRFIVKPTIETVIGVEDNKPEAIAALRKAAAGSGIEIVSFPTKYPSGGEKQLIQIITGKEVPSGGLPSQVGVVCQNLGTTTAIYKAVFKGEPLISRITTVTGNACSRQQNFEVLLGSPMSTLLDICGYDAKKASRLLMGGPMMGFALPSAELPIVKTTNCILAPTPQELEPPTPPQACIRCGMCAEACPVSLLPQQMYWFARSKNHDGLMDHNLMDCIECGACSFACPSNIPLVQYYRASKADIRKADAEAKKAEYSKERFEARLERLERAEAEKEAKRKERQEKAAAAAAAKKAAEAEASKAESTTPAAADDPVAAAIARAKAKAEGGASDPVQEAKDKLAGLEKRLAKAEDKLKNAIDTNDDNVDAFRTSVEKLQEKIDAAKATLAKAAPSSPAPAANDDPVAAAIARAKAKAEGNSDPLADAQAKVQSLEKRLVKAEEKHKTAVETNDDNVEAFAGSLEKLKQKLEEAKAEVAKHQTAAPSPTPSTDNDNDSANDDPVAAAIARAKAKAEGNSDPIEEAKAKVTGLEKRLVKAKEKHQTALETNDDNLDAFASSLEKLEAKLKDAKAHLASLNGNDTAPSSPQEKPQAASASADSDDPVAAAIAKAQAKRAGGSNDLDPKAKLEQDIAALEKRIANAESKLASAKEENPAKAEALETSLEKLQAKLADSKQQLVDL